MYNTLVSYINANKANEIWNMGGQSGQYSTLDLTAPQKKALKRALAYAVKRNAPDQTIKAVYGSWADYLNTDPSIIQVAINAGNGNTAAQYLSQMTRIVRSTIRRS